MYIYPVTTIASSRTVAQYAQFLGLRLQGMQGAMFGTMSVRITIPRQRPVRLFGSGRGKGIWVSSRGEEGSNRTAVARQRSYADALALVACSLFA